MTKLAKQAITEAKRRMKAEGWITTQTTKTIGGGAQFYAVSRGGSHVVVKALAVTGDIITQSSLPVRAAYGA